MKFRQGVENELVRKTRQKKISIRLLKSSFVNMDRTEILGWER